MTEFMSSENPEYQAAYEAEMKRLEAGEKPSASTPAKAEDEETTTKPITSESEQKALEVDESIAAQIKELQEKNARQEKALKDTQRAFHETRTQLAEMRKQREAEVRAASKPAMLEANPGLEESIRYVAGVPPAEPTPQELNDIWYSAVSGAIPDVDALLADDAFYKAAEEKRNELGPEQWRNPVVAIRELSTLARRFAVEKATANAKADYAKQQNALSTMRVSGGSGRDPATSDRVNGKTAEDIWAMPTKDFEAERRRVLGGYSF